MRQQLGTATISVRRPRTGARVWRPWLLGWGGMVVAAVANGVLREVLIRPVLGETWAKVVSTATLLAMLAAWQWWLLVPVWLLAGPATLRATMRRRPR